MTSISQQLTFETRLPRDLPPASSAALEAYAALFSYALREYVVAIGRKQVPGKSEFMAQYGLTARQFNAVKSQAEGLVASRMSNLPNYIAQCRHKLEGLAQRLAKTQVRIADIRSGRKQGDLDKCYRSLAGFRQRIQILNVRQAKFEAELKRRFSPICFGSKRLFKKQFELKANGYRSHDQWKADWQQARRSQFFVKGSKGEGGGCQGCTLLHGDDGRWLLRVRLPTALVAEHGTHLLIEDVEFNYRPELLEQALAKQAIRNEMKGEFTALKRAGKLPIDPKKDGPVSEDKFLEDYGHALSYRFLRDVRGWRVLVSTAAEFEEVPADFANGAIGVDFNDGFVSVVEVDRAGHKVRLEDLPYTRLNATSPQNKTAMQALAVRIVAQAKAGGKPVVIEKLDFKRKKAGLQKGQSGKAVYHQMLSALSYKAFRQALLMQCLKQGVALVPVGPAYTSLLGKLKYNRETEFNTHQAAAWVIARRGMGLRERIPRKSPVFVGLRLATYTPPADERSVGTFKALASLQSDFARWYKTCFAVLRDEAQRLSTSDPFPDIAV